MNNVVITTVIEMVEMVEILDGRLAKPSARDNIVVLVKYLVILHADPCNKSYLYCTLGRNIFRGRRPREIFSTEVAIIYAGISQGLGLNI